MNKGHKTSWHKVGKWYNKLTTGSGHYYHSHVVIPGVLRLLDLKDDSNLLDLACGNGVLARNIPEKINYLGIDIAKSLIEEAKKSDKNPTHGYEVFDVTKEIQRERKFTHLAIILALQNMENPEGAIINAKNLLVQNGRLVMVLNHPCFRIPRQSSWGVDENSKLQYRRIDRYMSRMEIPIKAHPGQKHSAITWSYHSPLSFFFKLLNENGFVIEKIEEWTSDKQSEGKSAKMENRAREEIPMFLTIVAKNML